VAFISVYSKSFRTKVLPELRVLSITHRMKKIITGTKLRSRRLDVFVSRLRKILKADDSLAIKTVHGVGYRLEVLWG